MSSEPKKIPHLLMILDGWGLAPAGAYNAVTLAKTPHLDALFASCPHSRLACSGEAVGLPQGQMGNSEVGHTNIGAGRVVYQELTRITKSIREGDFYQNPALLSAVRRAKECGGTVHLMGLLSDGGVHSHIDHLFALLELCRREGVTPVVHSFLDGRDTPPQSGERYLALLEEKLTQLGGRMGVIAGRFYAMDRDKRWERLSLAYDALALGKAPVMDSAESAIRTSYAAGVTDEFFRPVMIRGGQPIARGDSVIFFNFRPDRAREITRALCDPDFNGFARENGPICPDFVCFTQYDAEMPGVKVAFPPEKLYHIFGEWISQQGKTQLRIAETEKYAHVTFFFNGGEERTFPGEDRVLIPSPKVATYDLQPEMSAYPLAEECVRRIESGKYDAVILNFANCDMVGHTGVLPAAVRAMEAVDDCVGKVLAAVRRMGGDALITADHGNAECMELDGVPFTQHTTNPVPLILVGKTGFGLEDGALCDLAPTLLDLMGLTPPAEMTGHSLLKQQ